VYILTVINLKLETEQFSSVVKIIQFWFDYN